MKDSALPPSMASPYADLGEDYQRRLNATISSEDWNLVRAVCPLHGAWNAILGMFVHSLCDELRKRNITTYDPDGLLNTVIELTSPAVPLGTSSSPDRHSDSPDEPRRTATVSPKGQVHAIESADASRATANRRGRTRSGRNEQQSETNNETS